ncbi:MAG: Stf0 family sulfotransferase [Anaerolineales bacterium]
MAPRASYTIWFTQRTGSTLICKALESTGVAGVPREWFSCPPDLLSTFRQDNYADLQDYLWKLGTTPNGVFGINYSFYEPHFTQLIETLRKFPACLATPTIRRDVWESIFPNHRHIFMTRRNKVRLAVSWWRAIQSGEWHLPVEEPRKSVDLSNAYSYDAIHHLYDECSMREAGIQDFFSEGGIAPLTVVYEDFIQDYEGTIQNILNYLGLNSNSVTIAPPALTQLADDISEEWAQRFREERQQGWVNRGW